MANSNTWTVALTFSTVEEKEKIKREINERAKQEYRSPSSYIKNLVLRHVQGQE